jgi:phosphoribosyl 1,2-cyclic phosphodiesterase
VGRIGGKRFTLTFHGVRGSTPCHGDAITRYGGNTSCVSVDVPGQEPVLLDAGTGLRYFGLTRPDDEVFHGSCLLSHLHWDHVQGLPFFTPLLRPGSSMRIYAPVQESGESAADVLAASLRPPLFPIGLDDLPGEIEYRAVADDEFSIGDIDVRSRLIPHVGVTCGYRLTWDGRSVAYLSDHQQPHDGSFALTGGALELCKGADVLIHDAQYTPEEFAKKSTWGHCMVEYAVWVAVEAGARTLVLFHHDPSHDDTELDALVALAASCGRSQGVDVIGAREGLTLSVGA